MEFDLTDLPDLSSLDPDELRILLSQLSALYSDIEAQEPEDESFSASRP